MARVALVAATAAFLGLFSVQAIAAPPEVAEILEPPPGAAELNPADIHMEATFVDTDEHEHECSDWEIWTVEPAESVWETHCIGGAEKIHVHLGDGTFRHSHVGRTALRFSTRYELRVRFRDSGPQGEEWSDWKRREFTTRPAGAEGNQAQAWTPRPGYAVDVFAEDLQLPVNIAMVPDPGPHPGDPFMYVTELYGAIKVVTRDGSVRDYKEDLLNFNPTGKFPGSGEMGVTGIVVDPVSSDLFVSLVYRDEESGEHYPKVVRFENDEQGLVPLSEDTVLDMKGAKQGASHQVSNLTISPEGELYVHNGDGGGGRDEAPDPDSFLGKVLRMTLDGEPLSDNPFYTDDGEDTARDYVWAKGFRNPFGGAWRLSDATHYTVENGPSIDRLARVLEGRDYGWPADESMSYRASYRWIPPHAPVNIEFVEGARFGGSGFPPWNQGHAFVSESGSTWATGPQLTGKRIVEFDLDGGGWLVAGPTTLVEYTGLGKATAVGLAAGADGLYFTELYKDTGFSSPIDRGAKILRVRYCGAACPGAQSPPVDAVAPLVKGFRVQRKVFAVGLGRRVARAAAARQGTVFRYWLSEPAQANIQVRLIATGWRVDRGSCGLLSKHARVRLRKRRSVRRCVLPYARGVRYGKRCRRGSWRRGPGARKRRRCVLRGPRGRIKSSGTPGRNARPYAGRLGKRKLRPAHYLAIIHTRDAGGNPSEPRYTHFRIARPGKGARGRRGSGRGA